MNAPSATPSPFGWIQPAAQRSVLWVLAVLSIGLLAILVPLGTAPDLITTAAPAGMLSFNLAGSAARARAVLASWSDPARGQTLLFLGLDYLFLCLYPAFWSLASIRLAARVAGAAPAFAAFGRTLAWWLLTAGLFDAVENYALIRQLLTAPGEGWAQLAWWCALPKFGLPLIGLGYSLIAYLLSITARERHPDE